MAEKGGFCQEVREYFFPVFGKFLKNFSKYPQSVLYFSWYDTLPHENIQSLPHEFIGLFPAA